MNFLANPKWDVIAQNLFWKKCKVELICGVDYRLLDQEKANLLNVCGFKKMRWAWDYTFASGQKKHRKVLQMFLKAGYKPEELSVFILVNWKIPYVDCVKKLDLLKVWNVKVNDCCWDGGYKQAKPKYWDIDQIKRRRKICRKHKQIELIKIEPNVK